MESASLRLAICAVALLPVTCVGQQQCDTSAFTYNQANRSYYIPGGTNSATSPSQCGCLQQQWDTITQQINTEHENCLTANQNEPNIPNSGSTPGSSCSRSSCQSLHDALFTTMAPKEKEEMDACNASVAKYQAEVQAQQATQQQRQATATAAAQVGQQQRAQELPIFKQQIAMVLKTQQDAAQKLATTIQQLQPRTSQPSPTPQNSDADATATADSTPVSAVPNPTPGPTPAAAETAASVPGTDGAAVPAPAPTPVPLDSINLGDPAIQSVLADALNSSDPIVQGELAQYEKNMAQLQQNQTTEAGLASQAHDEECTQLIAGCLAAVASLKAPADAAAAGIGLYAPGFTPLYNAATGFAGAVSQGFASSEFPTTEAIKAAGETGGSTGEYSTYLSEQASQYAKENPDSILAPGVSQMYSTAGKSLSVLGGTVGTGVNGYQAVQAYQQGSTFGTLTYGGMALGNFAQAGGVILSSPLTSTIGGGVATTLNLVQSAPASYNAAADAIGDLHQAFSVIPQQYSNMISSYQQRDAQIQAQQQALLQAIQQQLQSQSVAPPTTITVP